MMKDIPDFVISDTALQFKKRFYRMLAFDFYFFIVKNFCKLPHS